MKYLHKNIIAFEQLTWLKIKKIWMFKANIVSQGVGMFLNNFAFLTVWWLLMQRFGNINGYSFDEIVLIQGYVAMFYAWFYFFIGGVLKLSDYINQDRFLDLQIYPVSPLTILATKSGAASQIGDFCQGGLMLAIFGYLHPASIGWVVIGLGLTIVGLFGVTLVLNSLLFYFPRVLDSFADLIQNVFIGASMYPSQNFEGGMKYFLYLILLIPIISFPVEVTRGFLSPLFLIYSVIAVVTVNVLGYFLWKNGIKRVESGSGGGVVE